MLSRERTLFQWDFKYSNRMLPFQWVSRWPSWSWNFQRGSAFTASDNTNTVSQSLPVSRSETAESFVESLGTSLINIPTSESWKKETIPNIIKLCSEKQHCWSYWNFTNSTRSNYQRKKTWIRFLKYQNWKLKEITILH